KTALDDYEYIYVPTNFTEDKWIQAGEVLPGDRRVVHHATVSVIDQAEYAKHLAEHAKENTGVDEYHYRTGKVLHLRPDAPVIDDGCSACRSEEHTSELQSRSDLVCRLLLEKKKKNNNK